MCRHCGVAITSGERYLLVGFAGVVAADAQYSALQPDRAAHDAFCRFGLGAWDRSSRAPPTVVVSAEPKGALEVELGDASVVDVT
eukprot:737530-Prymnesium_polylepis.1